MRRNAIRAAQGKPAKGGKGAGRASGKDATAKPPRRTLGRALADGARRTRAAFRRDGQVGLLIVASHPLQAVVLAGAMGVLAFYSDRGWGESLAVAAAVLLVQLALGLHNDACDGRLDALAKAPRKPVGAGDLPAGNARFFALILVVISIPVSLLSGTVAAPALLVTLPIGYIHNRILHRTLFSFLGWMLTFSLYPVFLAYGGWGAGRHGDDPTWQFLVVSAFVGLCAHLATSLPDLVGDNAAGVRSLPLRIALRTGAPRLLIGTVILSLVVLGAFVWIGLDPGLRQW